MISMFDRINQRLEELGVSQRSASIKAGLHPDTLNKLLSKPEQSPTLETIRKVAQGLDTTPEWLAFGIYRDPRFAEPEKPKPPLSSLMLPAPPGIAPRRDNTYIQVSAETLHRYVSGALQNESIPEEQADAYADAVLELMRGRATAHVVLRLEGAGHNAPEFQGPRPDDRS